MTNMTETMEPGADKLAEYDEVVKSANNSAAFLNSQTINKLEELLRDIDSDDDPVYQGNCLQLVADLASSKPGLQFLEIKKVPQKLEKFIESKEPLIVPHALKFFYQVNPLDFRNKYARVLNQIFDYFQSDNNQLIDYAVDLVAAIGRCGYSARKVLDDNHNFRPKCLQKMGRLIISSDSLLKTRTLSCIKDLLIYRDQDPIEESHHLSESFYHSIIEGEGKMTRQLLILCRVPFKEISTGAEAILEAIRDQDWAKREIEAQNDLKQEIKVQTA